MSSDEPKRNPITRNLRLAYDDVATESIPERFQQLLRKIDGREDGDYDLDPGIGAEPPRPPKGGPKASGAAEPRAANRDTRIDGA